MPGYAMDHDGADPVLAHNTMDRRRSPDPSHFNDLEAALPPSYGASGEGRQSLQRSGPSSSLHNDHPEALHALDMESDSQSHATPYHGDASKHAHSYYGFGARDPQGFLNEPFDPVAQRHDPFYLNVGNEAQNLTTDDQHVISRGFENDPDPFPGSPHLGDREQPDPFLAVSELRSSHATGYSDGLEGNGRGHHAPEASQNFSQEPWPPFSDGGRHRASSNASAYTDWGNNSHLGFYSDGASSVAPSPFLEGTDGSFVSPFLGPVEPSDPDLANFDLSLYDTDPNILDTGHIYSGPSDVQTNLERPYDAAHQPQYSHSTEGFEIPGPVVRPDTGISDEIPPSINIVPSTPGLIGRGNYEHKEFPFPQIHESSGVTSDFESPDTSPHLSDPIAPVSTGDMQDQPSTQFVNQSSSQDYLSNFNPRLDQDQSHPPHSELERPSSSGSSYMQPYAIHAPRSHSRGRSRSGSVTSNSSANTANFAFLSPYSPSSTASGSSRERSQSRDSSGSRRSFSNVRDHIYNLSTDKSKARELKNPPTFTCAEPGCNKRFTRAYNLRSHQRTHTNEKPYLCSICGKSFARQHDRRRHERLHSGLKEFVCEGQLKNGSTWGCGKKFARMDALSRHFRSEIGKSCIRPLLQEGGFAPGMDEQEALADASLWYRGQTISQT